METITTITAPKATAEHYSSNQQTTQKTTNYDYIHKPKHYQLFTVDDLKKLIAEGKGIDVVTIANKAKLNKDAYMFNVLKYVLRQEKPGEPRRRDVKKIREYADIWLENDKDENSFTKQ